MTQAELAQLAANADQWFEPLQPAMAGHWINTPDREAMFLATILYESNGFLSLAENLNYSARGILRMWPARFSPQEATDYTTHPERIANRAYANRNGNGNEASGDGWHYRGRGLIQLTGRRNFERAEAACGMDLVARPELLEEPMPACEVAAWFWADAGCNEIADEGDFAGTQGVINRGSRHKAADNLNGREQWLQKVRNALR